MSLLKPYPHMYRNEVEKLTPAFFEMTRSAEGRSSVESFKLLQKDLNHLFEYIEPSVNNLTAYSHRTYELLLRACTEFESNVKIIYEKNNCRPSEDNIKGYSDLEGPMRLSAYQVECYLLDIQPFHPFCSFKDLNRDHRSPNWYKSYNSVKHHRAQKFKDASLENVIHAIGAVYAILDAQFGFGFQLEMVDRSWGPGDGQIFSLKSIPKWNLNEQYADINWESLKKNPDPFNFCPIPRIP